MLGNWATGRARMVSEPISTNKIEMTMATMGRLMKNFDMGSLPLVSHGEGFRVHRRAGTNLLHTFDDNFFAGLQAIGDDPVGANLIANRNRANTDFVIGAHNGD